MPSELKLCPFCGCGLAAYSEGGGPAGVWSCVSCSDCGAQTDDEETWNRRALTPEVKALVDELRACLVKVHNQATRRRRASRGADLLDRDLEFIEGWAADALGMEPEAPVMLPPLWTSRPPAVVLHRPLAAPA